MKIAYLLLTCLLIPESLLSPSFNMSFKIKYDKSQHGFNLLVNKKHKLDRRLRNLIRNRSRKLIDFVFHSHDKNIKQIERLLEKRAYLTKNKDKQDKIDNLKEEIRGRSDKLKSDVSKQLSKSNRQAAGLFAEMKNNLLEKLQSMGAKAILSGKESDIIQTVKQKYKNQYTKIKNGILSAEDKIDNVLPGFKTKMNKEIVGLTKKDSIKHKKKKKRKKKQKKLKKKKVDEAEIEILTDEVKKVDKQLKRKLKRLNGKEIKSNLNFILNKTNSNIDEYMKGFRHHFKHGSGRSLKQFTKERFTRKLMVSKPVWLIDLKKVKEKQKHDLALYKNKMIRKLIDTINNKQWEIVNKDGKRFGFVKQMDLYLPMDELGNVDKKIIDNITNSLSNKITDNKRKLNESFTSVSPVMNNKPVNTAPQPQDQNNDISNETKDLNNPINAQTDPDLNKRKLLDMGGMAGGMAGGAMAGIALGAANAFRKKSEVDAKTKRLDDTIKVMQARSITELKGQDKLHLLKLMLKTDYSHLRAITQQIVFRLDAKYDDLFKLLSEQQIY